MSGINITTQNCSVVNDLDYYAKTIYQDVKRPSRVFTPFIVRVIISIFFASLIVLAVLKKFSMVAIVSIILLSIIFYIMLINMSGDNIAGSLPYATYPLPPHLGLDGISLSNRST